MNRYVIIHEHRFGTSVHFAECAFDLHAHLADDDENDWEKSVAMCKKLDINFEPDLNESLEIVALYGTKFLEFKL